MGTMAEAGVAFRPAANETAWCQPPKARRSHSRLLQVLAWAALAVQAVAVLSVSLEIPLLPRVIQLSLIVLGATASLFGSRLSALALLLAASVCWASLQIIAGVTVRVDQTFDAALYWASLLGLAMAVSGGCRRGERFRHAMVLFGLAVLVLDVLQTASSHGKLFWIVKTAYEDVYGPFASQNNFAEFMELLVPLVFWQSLQKPRGGGWLEVTICAFCFGAVLACGSRAGVLLLAGELILLVVIAARRRLLAARQVWSVVALMIAAVLVTAFVLPADRLVTRLQEESFRDIRWTVLQSVKDVIAERPVQGVGLGTFQTVYPSYMRADNGLAMAHAHNDWAEWSAEGGLVWVLLLALGGLWCAYAAWRQPFSLGVPVVLLHALVDFPMQRIAIAGLLVTIIAITVAEQEPSSQQSRNRWPQLAIAIILLAAALGSALSLCADSLAHSHLEQAMHLLPFRASLWEDWAVLHRDAEEAALRRAIQLNPYGSAARLQLAVVYEGRGDLARAENELRIANIKDRSINPKWALAGFCFRTERRDEFAHAAQAAMMAGRRDWQPLFRWSLLLFHDDATAVLTSVIPDRREVLEQYLKFLHEQGHFDAELPTVKRLMSLAPGNPELLLNAIDDQIRTGRVEQAVAIDHLAGSQSNEDFARKSSGKGFDWRLSQQLLDSAFIEWMPGQLRLTFDGRQPDSAILLEKTVVLPAAVTQICVETSYRIEGVDTETGLQWRLDMTGPTGLSTKLMQSALRGDYSSARTCFLTPPASRAGFARLALEYERPKGQARLQGEVRLFTARVTRAK